MGGVMRVALTRPKRAHAFLTFGLPLFLFPSLIGGSDLSISSPEAGLAAEQAKPHLIGSPFGTIHAATFQFPAPLGSAIPEVVKPILASYSPDEGEADQGLGRRFVDRYEPEFKRVFPSVDRTRKGDRLTTPPDASVA